VKLNLGAHGTRLPGFLSVDLLPDTQPDIVGNLLTIEFADASIEEIYCSHTLEHFTYLQAFALLEKFERWLMPEGILWLAVPDFEALCQIVTAGEGHSAHIRGLFYGGDHYETDVHKSGWTRRFLREVLEARGYEIIGDWNAFVTNAEGDGSDAAGVWFEWSDGRRQTLSLNWRCRKVGGGGASRAGGLPTPGA